MKFEIYRYQLLPIDRFGSVQLEMFEKEIDITELLARKNEFFWDAITSISVFEGQKSSYRNAIIAKEGDTFLAKLNVNRVLKRETIDFKSEEIETWPSFRMLIWNNPAKQYLVIQDRRDAFQKPITVLKAVTETVNIRLAKYNLKMILEPLFKQDEFWSLVEAHSGKITEILFELVTPNMSNISEELSEELKDFSKGVNAQFTKLDISSDPESALVVSKDVPRVQGLVSYASEGGGNITLKIKGIKRRISTKSTRKSVEIEDIEIQGRTPDQVLTLLKGLLDGNSV